MKKRDLAKLAMLGISAAMIVGCGNAQGDASGEDQPSSGQQQQSSDMQSFYNSLSSDAQKKFNQLDAQHKMMAIEMTHQTCNGKNSCAGMGGCKTSQNSCAGQNGCKGQGGEPIKDPNKAVEVQYKNQQKQRQGMNQSMNAPQESVTEEIASNP